MFKKVLEYVGPCEKLTIQSGLVILAVVLVSILPFMFVYQAITPLIVGSPISSAYISLRILAVMVCLVNHACLYVKGPSISHEAAFHILMRLRAHLQKRVETLSLSETQGKGTGNLRRMFIDDVGGIEILLAHVLPEGFGNLVVLAAVYLCLFVVDRRLALMSLASPSVGLLSMCVMFVIGSRDTNNYCTAGKMVNSTIIEYINGMEVVRVSNKDRGSH